MSNDIDEYLTELERLSDGAIPSSHDWATNKTFIEASREAIPMLIKLVRRYRQLIPVKCACETFGNPPIIGFQCASCELKSITLENLKEKK